MSQESSQNHYDVLQVSHNASQDVIEKMFRFLASQYHPDAGGEKDKFNQIVAAFEVLRSPTSRVTYDLQLKNQVHEIARLVEHSKQAGPDSAIRHELLRLFYARRRQNGSSPTLGSVAIERTMKLPKEILEFHIWYFKEKGWVERGDNGGFAITAEGVDQIESSEFKSNQLHIAATPDVPRTADSQLV